VKAVVGLFAAAFLACRCPGAASEWTRVQSPHFEVYSQTGEQEGRAIASWLEQLRTFFSHELALAPATLQRHEPVRVVQFRSASDYARFQPRPTADAFFIGAEAADYIVMPQLGQEESRIAAHEYAHLVLHSLGLQLPQWFAEGLAEFFSTVRIGKSVILLGGDVPTRTHTLRQRPLIPLQQLLHLAEDAPMRVHRDGADLFYSESWALVDMLVSSPEYAPRFNRLWEMLRSESNERDPFVRVYGKSADAVMSDLKSWVRNMHAPLRVSATFPRGAKITASGISDFQVQRMVADLLLACGQLDRAQAAFNILLQQTPNDPVVFAELGTIALRKKDPRTAIAQWRRAVELGIEDARLCYRFATLAEDEGASQDDTVSALMRAVELRPDFDDARYMLGLRLASRGRYEDAVEQLQAIRAVPAARKYAYYTALASALTEMDRRQEAADAAHNALMHAQTAEERASALRLGYTARTDLTVQFSRDANGNLQLTTARKPHGSDNWNPFIEPSDQIRTVTGEIRKVQCTAGRISGFQIAAGLGIVDVSLPDPAHVLITGGTPEFVCGAEDGRAVDIEYAASNSGVTGVLRGLKFRAAGNR
jgi:tetratricopeptide (TPR) repeat protein